MSIIKGATTSEERHGAATQSELSDSTEQVKTTPDPAPQAEAEQPEPRVDIKTRAPIVETEPEPAKTPAPAPTPATVTAPQSPSAKRAARAALKGWEVVSLDVRQFGDSMDDTIEAVGNTLRNADPIESNSFERIAMPGGAGTQFKRDTAGGAVHTDDITAVIVLNETARVYFQPGQPLGKVPPVCSSRDGVWGFGDPGDELRAKNEGCVSCVLSRRGSASTGTGSACRELRVVAMIEDDRPIAAVLKLPPTSLAALDRYSLQLFNDGFELSDVATTISLDTRQVGDQTVAAPVFRVAGVLDDPSREYARAYSRMLKAGAKTAGATLLAEGRKRPSAAEIAQERSEAAAHGGEPYEEL